MAQEIVDLVIVVDDHSHDATVERAKKLPKVIVHEHPKNVGYGGNQKTCYRLAVEHGRRHRHHGAPRLPIHAQVDSRPWPASWRAVSIPACLHRAFSAAGAIKGRMPLWRYIANRALTAADNILLGSKLSEFHTGYRAFSRELLTKLPLDANSDDFVFDNQMLAQTIWMGFQIGEVSCPTRYATDASSINFRRSVQYGFGCLRTGILFRLCKWRAARSALFPVESIEHETVPA
jgi:hypothetical protein